MIARLGVLVALAGVVIAVVPSSAGPSPDQDASSSTGGFSVPWELVRIRKDGQELLIRHPRFVSDTGERLDEVVRLGVKESSGRVRLRVVIRRHTSAEGGTPAYPNPAYGTIMLRRPLANRDMIHAAIDRDLFPDGGRRILDTLRELPSGRER